MYVTLNSGIRHFAHQLKHNSNQIRRNSYYKHKLSAKVECAINIQIQAEQQAAQNYLSLAATFLHPCQSRPGAGGYFMRMYEEELQHSHDFIQYQLLRGGVPVISSISAPEPINGITLSAAFVNALEMEKLVTEMLEKLVSVAESEKDWQCADYVTSVFLAEQMKSMNEMAHHVTRLCRLVGEPGLYHYDLELARNYPYTFKRKQG